MKKWLLSGGLVAATMLLGCSSLHTGADRELDCSNAANCRVQVFVKCPGSCSTSVEFGRVIGKRNGEIVWEIENQSGQAYEFARNNGIVFPGDAGRNFDCHVEAAGRRFSCKNRGDRGEFKYTVNLVGAPTVGPLDPWVVNN